MGTRSNTLIIETGHGQEIVLVNIYRQMDGYPACMGAELAEFIAGTKMVNGLTLDVAKTRIANGAGCFAAQLIAHLKTEAGGIYLNPPLGECEHDYTYKIRINTYQPSTPVHIEVWKRDVCVMKGNIQKFQEFCAIKEEVSCAY